MTAHEVPRFTIEWCERDREWWVMDQAEIVPCLAAVFSTLAEAEAYCIERQARAER